VEHLSRPNPTWSVGERARAWVEWFGMARLVAASVAVVAVCAGAYWLVRTPPPPSEASLPRAVASSTTELAAAGERQGPPAGAGGVPATNTPVSTGPITVHVAGAVARPGVYELPAEARVHSAVEAAGGATAASDPDALNLAAVLADGTRVYVPMVGEDVPVDLLTPPGPPTEPAAAGLVDVNRATLEQLQTLPGVGPATASAIVTERERNGPFLGVDDLDRVPGIGPAKLDAIRDLVTT
jgi:competence protein ComEA